VNAWFQNKRASSKKRTRTTGGGDRANSSHPNTGPSTSPTVPTASAASITTASTPSEVAPPPLPPLSHLTNEDEYLSSRIQHPVPSKMSFMDMFNSTTLSTFVTQPDYSGLSSGRTTPDGQPKKMRLRPSGEQTEELKKVYNSNPHPTAEERQALADRVGM
jgi:Homeodomain